MSFTKSHLDYSLTLISWFSLSVLFLALCFGWLLPQSYGQENGPEEFLQAVILGLAALVAISALFQTHLSSARRKLFALSSVGLLIVIARELSWGRVFYMDSTGRIPPLKTLWFGPYIYPGVALIVIIALGYFFSQVLFGDRTEVYEELAELVSYTGVLSFMTNIVFNKRFHTKEIPKLNLKG